MAAKRRRSAIKSEPNSETKRDASRYVVQPKWLGQKRKRGKAPAPPLRESKFEIQHFEALVTLDGDPNVWDSLNTYKKFRLKKHKFTIGDVVYVYHDSGSLEESEQVPTNDLTMETEPSAADATEATDATEAIDADDTPASRAVALAGRKSDRRRNFELGIEPLSEWVAEVLEIRAVDPNYVFLRVNWLYRPGDFAIELGHERRPWNGPDEVVPSNHQQVIDAMTVNGVVRSIKRFDETNDDEILESLPADNDLIWRQTFDVFKRKLTPPLRTICKCKKPIITGQDVVKCSVCKELMHMTCIQNAMIERAQEMKIPDLTEADTTRPFTPQEKRIGFTSFISGMTSAISHRFKGQEKAENGEDTTYTPNGAVTPSTHARDGQAEDEQTPSPQSRRKRIGINSTSRLEGVYSCTTAFEDEAIRCKGKFLTTVELKVGDKEPVAILQDVGNCLFCASKLC